MAAGGAQAQSPPPVAAPDLQSLFDEGRTALREGEHERAAQTLYSALQALQKLGRGASVDAGLILAHLARALEYINNPQTDEAFTEALILLERAADPDVFIHTSNAFLHRHYKLDRKDEGRTLAQRIISRLTQSGVTDEARLNGLNIVVDYFSATDRKNDADKALETLGPLLEATTPRAARIRGIARIGLARASRDDGRLNDFVRESDGAIDDLRRALPESAALLGGTLSMRGKMLLDEGLYLQALPRFAEAAAVLANAPGSEQDFVEASALQARMLSRIERSQEALELIDSLVGQVDKRHGVGSRLWAAIRLDRVEMLMNTDKREEAVRQLNEISEQMGGAADHFIAGQYFDRLAAIEIAEENYTAAAQAAERSIAAYREGFPDAPALQLEPMRKRAHASEGLLDTAFGDRAFRELIDLSVRIYRPEHPEVARDLNAYATFLQIAGRLDEAEGLLRRAVLRLERAYGSTGQKYAYGLNNLAQILSMRGRHGEAAQWLERAITIVGDVADQAEIRAILRMNYANALNFLGRADEALAILKRIQDDLPQMGGRRERHAVNADMITVMTLAHLGRLDDSWREGARTFERLPIRTKEDAQNGVSLLLQMADVARRGGDDKNALAATAEAAKLMTSQGVETDRLWREWAQVSLPSLWRMGHP
jgi:tetratricopeptide (TPR) repeat protein